MTTFLRNLGATVARLAFGTQVSQPDVQQPDVQQPSSNPVDYHLATHPTNQKIESWSPSTIYSKGDVVLTPWGQRATCAGASPEKSEANPFPEKGSDMDTTTSGDTTQEEIVATRVSATDLKQLKLLEVFHEMSEWLGVQMNHIRTNLRAGQRVSEISIKCDDNLKALTNTKRHCVLACPTTICVNECLMNFAPVIGGSAEFDRILKTGDVVKVHMGLITEGYKLEIADSFLVQFSEGNEKLDVVEFSTRSRLFSALAVADEGIRRLVRNGIDFNVFHKFIETVAHDYGIGIANVSGITPILQLVHTTLSEATIESSSSSLIAGNVYAVDITFSSATTSNPIVDHESPITMYDLRREAQKKPLIMKAARKMLTDVREKYPHSIFHLNHYQNSAHARLGLREMHQQGLVSALPVIIEKGGECSVRRKFTFYLANNRMHIYPSFNPANSRIREVPFVAPKSREVITVLQQAFFIPSKNKSKRTKQKKQVLPEFSLMAVI